MINLFLLTVSHFSVSYSLLSKPLQHKQVPLSLLGWWGFFFFLIPCYVIPSFTFLSTVSLFFTLTNPLTYDSPFFLFLKKNKNLIFIVYLFIIEFLLLHAPTCMFSSCLSDLDWITRIFAIFPFCLLLERELCGVCLSHPSIIR